MSFVDHTTATHTCMLLESKAGSEDHIDLSQYDSSMLHEGGNFVCGYTARVNGPDYRPADPATCVRGRACFKAHNMF
jgi:hypothetical protein